MNKLDYNKKSIGKRVFVLTEDDGPLEGTVESVKDEYTFVVKLLDGTMKDVDIMAIRYP